MIIDGRAMAKDILQRTKARAERLSRKPLVVALTASDTPATRSYLATKQKRAADAGCILEIRQFDLGSGINNFILSAQVVDSAPNADAIIVQLPLPEGVDTKAVCDAIPVEKDADVLSFSARALFEMSDLRSHSLLLPPVVGAVDEILKFGKIEIKGKKAVVVGAGFLVGSPVAVWLRQQGAYVEIIDMPENFARARATLAQADIIVSGAGSPHLIKPEMLKEGAVLIDAGTSESGGALAGDADPLCAEKCSIFTPVPGGVGPISVACLFANVVILAEQKNSSILSS